MSRKALDIFTTLIFFISFHRSSHCSSPASAHSNKQFKLLKDVRSVKHSLSQLYHLDKSEAQSPSFRPAELYYTKVSLGSPPKELFVQIDTAVSDIWVSCSSCNGCPQTGLHLPSSSLFFTHLIIQTHFIIMSRRALDIFTTLIFFISFHCSSHCSSPASAHSNKQFKLLKDVRSVKHSLSQLYHLDKSEAQSPSFRPAESFPVLISGHCSILGGKRLYA
ncbi:hypothetical protein CTI12_AA320950 [Artemisia annua]|uniref:Peptidase A1 domain-containing protein n=1 Tax=Artemisia annua TaxID=35608 RepID=A0A2U1N0X5_ARTAN|nr:hypothetical protein CTI12_AA320950 [Artemisia annua]